MASNDPPADELLRHVDWLRELAHSLVRDPGLADDAAQDACMAALASPPRSWRHPRAWLATVLRRGLSRHARRRARVRALERGATARGPAPSSSESAERAELHRRLVCAVRALDEPFQSAVVYRFFRGLSPIEIAERTGVPAATVRTRVARGLARMRAELDRNEGQRRWRTACVAYWGVPAVAKLPVLGAAVMKKSAVALTVILAVAACVWIVHLWAGRTDPVDRSATAVAKEGGTTTDGPTLTALAGDRTRAAASGPSEREDSSHPSRRRFSVRCVDAAGRPVAGAWVGVADGADAANLRALGDIAAWRGPNRDARRTGADGLAVMSGDKRAAVVVAQGPGGEYGEWSRRGALEENRGRFRSAPESLPGFDVRNLGTAAEWEDAARPVQILLAPSQTTAIRTVAPDGTASPGVPIRWRTVSDGRPDDWRAARTNAPEGLALLRRAASETGVIEVEARVLARKRPRISITRGSASAEPTALPVPFLGSLVVRVLDRDGRALQFVHVRAGVKDTSVHAYRSYDTAARFDHVAVGVPLEVRAWTLGGLVEQATDGPAQSDDVVRVDIQAVAGGLVLAGKILDPTNRPLADERFLLTATVPTVTESEARARWTKIRTHSDGTFRVDIRALGKSVPPGTRISISGVAGQEHSHRVIDDLMAVVTPGPAQGGVVDLGDIVLEPMPVLVSGRVLDEVGGPIAGAVVEATPDIDALGEDLPVMVSRDRGRSTRNHGRASLRLGADGWTAIGDEAVRIVRVGMSAVTDARGRFTIRWSGWDGRVPPVVVKAYQRGYVQVGAVRVPAGTERARIDLRRGFLIRGRVEGVRYPNHLRVSLIVGDAHAFELPVNRLGTFRSERSLAVPATIRLSVRGTDEVLTSRRVQPPESPGTVDIGTFDLSGIVTQIAVEGIDPKTQSRIRGARVLRRLEGDDHWRQAVREGESDIVTFPASAPPVLRVQALGYLRNDVIAQRSDMQVELQPAPVLIVVVENAEALPASPVGLELSLWRSTGDGSSRRVGPPVPVTGSRVELPTEGPGAHILQVHVTKVVGGEVKRQRLADADLQVRIDEGERRVPTSLSLDEHQIRSVGASIR